MVTAAFFVGFSRVPKVLGLSLIAQTDLTTPTDTPTEAPTTAPAAAPAETPTEVPSPTPTDVVPVESTAQPNVFMETPSDMTPTPTEEAFPTESPKETVTPEPTEMPAAVAFPDQNQEVNNESITEAVDEDKALSLTTTPENQTILLTGFAQNKLDDIKSFLTVNDQGSVNFAAQRLDSQVSQVLLNLPKVAPENKDKIQSQVNSLCASVDSTLRANETAVSEDTEADLEIVRARCLGTHL